MPNMLPVVSAEGSSWVCNFVVESSIPLLFSLNSGASPYLSQSIY